MVQTNESQEVAPVGFTTDIVPVNLKGTAVPMTQVLEEIAPEGEKIKKADLVGKPIVIHSVEYFSGQYGPALFVRLTDDNGELYNTIIANKVLAKKLWMVRANLPVSCTIIKVEREGSPAYYDFE